MYIETYAAQKDQIIAAAMNSAPMAPRRKPPLETAFKAVAVELQRCFVEGAASAFEAELEDAFTGFEIINGKHEDTTPLELENYESGVDDVIEKVCEPFSAYLSANWLGTNTIDARLWDDGEIKRISLSAAREMYRELSHEKTPAQILASAGIVHADVVEAYEIHTNQTPEQLEEKSKMAQTKEECALIMQETLGTDFDLMTVYADLEQVIDDDDEILVGGAAARLGAGPTEIETIQMAVLEVEDAADFFCTLIREIKPKSGRAVKAEAKAEKEQAAIASGVAGVVEPEVMQNLKAYGGVGDTAMAEQLGVSRSSYTNWTTGKSQFVATSEQRACLRAAAVSSINKLARALALIDGTDAWEIG